MAEERLQKVLATAGVASRRHAEEMIAAGRVSVNGEVLTEMGVKVDPDRDRIEVDGQPVSAGVRVYLAVNKPDGIVTTAEDELGRQTVLDLIPKEFGRVYPVGRLDMESRGLVLLTNDGDIAHKLTHPSFEHEKEYRVRVAGQPGQRALDALRQGIELDDGPTLPAEVEVLERKRDSSYLRVTLREGRKRQLRRMFDAIEHPVRDLIRTRIGPIQLGTLPPGEWRRLSAKELYALRRLAQGYEVEPVAPPQTPNRDLGTVEQPAAGSAAGGRRQAAGGRRQAEARSADFSRQPAESGRQQAEGSRQQAAGGKQQAAGSRQRAAGQGSRGAGERAERASPRPANRGRRSEGEEGRGERPASRSAFQGRGRETDERRGGSAPRRQRDAFSDILPDERDSSPRRERDEPAGPPPARSARSAGRRAETRRVASGSDELGEAGSRSAPRGSTPRRPGLPTPPAKPKKPRRAAARPPSQPSSRKKRSR